MLINSIPLLEAKDSSEIENIVTTNDALFREASLGDADATSDTKEAAQYRKALHQGYQTLSQRPVSTRLAVDICQAITGKAYDIRKTPSTTLKNSLTGEVVYTPPAGEARLRELLANWERFINEQHDLDPLVRMAVQHYQFEAIHPFGDGNGRTGRILNVLCLIQDGVLDLPTPISAGTYCVPVLTTTGCSVACHFAFGMGALAALHADRDRNDVGLDQPEDQGHPQPDGRDRGLHAQERAQDLLARAGGADVHPDPIAASPISSSAALPSGTGPPRCSRSWCASEF